MHQHHFGPFGMSNSSYCDNSSLYCKFIRTYCDRYRLILVFVLKSWRYLIYNNMIGRHHNILICCALDAVYTTIALSIKELEWRRKILDYLQSM